MQNIETTIDPRDAEIASLKEQVASADAAATRKSQELDDLTRVLFKALEPRIEALALNITRDAVRAEFETMDITDFEHEIGEMIDDRLPVPEDDESHREAVEAIVRDIISGATLTIDI